MLVPSIEQLVEVTSEPAEAHAKLARVIGTGLPIFVVDQAWASADEAAEALRPTFEERGFALDDSATLEEHLPPKLAQGRLGRLMSRLGYQSSGRDTTFWHSDGLPSPHPASLIKVHHTEEGEAVALFHEPTDWLLKMRRKVNSEYGVTRGFADLAGSNYNESLEKLISRGILERLLDGRVENTAYSPIRYVAHLTAGSTLVFRSGGQRPLLHYFKSTVLPRRSRVRCAQLRP
jgi:hypothetical protein